MRAPPPPVENAISEEYRLIAKKWVDAESAAEMLEQTKSAVLSKLMVSQGDMPVSKAEMRVKASAQWDQFIREMVTAREKASYLKVQLEYIRMRFSEQQSAEASRRAEMKL
jgi:hypothetical protein